MRRHDLFRWSTLVAVLLCYVTILLGGNVMASDSGLACPDWPSCHGTFLPPLGGAIGIEWVHRISAAILSVVVTVVLALALAYERTRPLLRRFSAIALAAVIAQGLLGAVVVKSDLSVGVVLLHLALATALFAVLILLALLANLREVPRRWVDWVRRASEEQPILAAEDRIPAVPAPPAPDPGGRHPAFP